MAQRRMFSLKIVNTDAFIEMPLSAQALYFHLGMNADDDGFVSNARRVQRLVGAADDDMKILLMKRFILAFDSGVIVIKHWRINNYVKGDRYTPTLYQEEKGQLYVKKNGVYTDHPLLPTPPTEEDRLPASSPADYAVEPKWSQNGTKPDTQVREGEGSKGEGSVGEDRKEKNNYFSGGDGTCAREDAEADVDDYLRERGLEPTDYFGVTEDVISEAAALTYAIFSRFTTRAPTKTDIDRVFLATRLQFQRDGEWIVTYPPEKKKLLMYAFEQAMNAGKPGDWRYIDGVLARIHQRQLYTLDDAEEYDFDRKET